MHFLRRGHFNPKAHPIFRLEARDHPARQTWPFFLRRLFWVIVPLMVLWVIIIWVSWSQASVAASTNSTFVSGVHPTYRLAGELVAWLTLLSLGAAVALDFTSITVSLRSIPQNIHWHLIRLTPLEPRGVIRAKHALAQMRARGMMAFTVGVRVALVLALVLQLAVIPIDYGSPDTSIQGVLTDLVDAPLELILSLLIYVIVLGVYIIEPLWRMRAFTAVGVAISARSRRMSSASLGGLGAMVGLWIAQVVLLLVSFWLFTRYLNSLTFPLMSQTLLLLNLVIYVTVVACLMYGFFWLMMRWGRRSAVRHAFMLESRH